MYRLSIIIPCYNEYSRDNLKENILQLLRLAEESKIQLIFVDDGSRDETYYAIHDCLSSLTVFDDMVLSRSVHPHESDYKYVICSYKRNKGKGYAIRTGIKIATGQYIGYLDADLSVEPQELLAMCDRADWRKGVIGVRADFGKRPLYRRLATKVVHAIASAVFKLDCTDTQCGCKVFPAWAMKMSLEHMKCLRWLFDVELLCIMQKYNLTIGEQKVQWDNSNNSRLTLRKDLVPTLFELVDLIFRLPTLRA